MQAESSAPRLLTPALAGYLLADLAGLLLIALGGSFLVTGSPLMLLGVPQTLLGAVGCIVAGFVLMLWALARVLVAVASHAQLRQLTQTKP
ncbi:MAG: hypothetical protein LWW84_10265 [Azovibrio sp.]|nr:hypothetical protein [Azovibrio sp.]